MRKYYRAIARGNSFAACVYLYRHLKRLIRWRARDGRPQ